MTDYLTDFVQESEERITELNNALLTLERDPTNDEAMESIFRVAHTLKSNCGAMGLESASDLAHAIEDLLDAVRTDDLEVTPELMDVIFDGVDELETMVDEVATEGEIDTDPSATIDALRAQLEDESGPVSITTPSTDEIDDVIERFDPPADDEHRAYLVRLAIAEHEEVNNGKLVIDALIDAFDLIGTVPSRETIEADDYGNQFDAVFGSAVGEGAITSGLEPVEEVDDFELVNVSDRFEVLAAAAATSADPAADPAPEPGDGLSTEDAENLDVDELLDEFDEFDNLDEMVEDVGDDELEAFDDMGEAGSFDDLLGNDDLDLDARPGEPSADSLDDETDADGTTTETTADADSATADSMSEPEDDVDDANAVFNELKNEVEMVGFDELQDELDELEFDEFDNDDEVDMDELIGDDVDVDDDSFLQGSEPTEAAVDDILVDGDDASEPSTSVETATTALDADASPAGDEPAATDDEGVVADYENEATDEVERDATEADEAETPLVASEPDEPAESEPTDSESPIEAGSTDSAAVDAEADAGFDEETIDTESEAETADTGSDEAAVDIGSDETVTDIGSDEATTDADDDVVDAEFDTGLEDERIDDEAAPDEESDAEFASATETVPPASEPTTADSPDEVDDGDDVVVADETDDELTSHAEDGELEDSSEKSVADDTAVDADTDDTTVNAGTADATVDADTADATEAADTEGATADDELDEATADGDDDDAADEPAESVDESDPADGLGTVPDDDLEPTSSFDDDSSEESVTDDEVDDPFAAEAGGDSVADDAADDSFADDFADDSFDDDAAFDEPDDDVFADDSAASTDFGDDAFADDDFDDSFGDDDFADDGFDDFDDSGFDSSPPEPSSGGSSAESFGDDAADDGDEDDRILRVDEPTFESSELTIPETTDRPDADQQTDEIQSVRVDVEQIDSLLTLVEGLVTSRVRLRHAVTEGEDSDALETELDDLEDLTTDLQETVMDVRLVPLQTVTNRLPRVVRDIARDQDKEVAFEITGEGVELDRSILDRVGDPLIHLVRNAVDHGIEPPAEREAADKSPQGTVEVHADRSRDRVAITVEDDGSGLDPERLRSEAVEAEIITEDEAAALSDDEAYELIFHPGLSTADEVTDVSGRGVGMDVVKRTIEDLEGTVSIDSDVGDGTTVTMTLPVSVAIDDILFVESGGEEFGVPTQAVQDIEPADSQPTLPADDGSVIRLDDALETPRAGTNGDGMVVRIRDEVRSVALHCDHVHGQQEVVVKPFEGFMSDIPGLSGATVRGRGEVVNILDVTTL